MGLMDEAMRSDARFSADTDAFGEQVTYTRADGTALTPIVIVDRNPPLRDPEYAVNTRPFDIQIAYDTTNVNGLASTPAKGDRVTLKADPSSATTTVKEYRAIVSADSGGWLVQFA